MDTDGNAMADILALLIESECLLPGLAIVIVAAVAAVIYGAWISLSRDDHE